VPKSSEKKAGWVANIAPLLRAKPSTVASQITAATPVFKSQKNGMGLF